MASLEQGHNPLAVAPPSPMHLLNYPLFVTSVKILCDPQTQASRGQSSILATFDTLRRTAEAEGLFGLYQGGHLYFLHMVARDALRLGTEKLLRLLGCRLAPVAPEATPEAQVLRPRRGFKQRLASKYLIEAISYPILLCSTRAIMLRGEPSSTWDRVCCWCRADGWPSLFNGVTCFLLAQALDEAMDVLLNMCVDTGASKLDVKDKFVLKASAQAVAGVFTSPISYVGIIQRCQSPIPGLLEPRNIRKTIWGLPWKSSGYQLILFSGIFALNATLIQAQLDEQNEEEE